MKLEELEKTRKELEKKTIGIEAKRELNQKELEKLGEEILAKTGLDSLDNLDEYIARIEGELEVGKNKFAQELSELNAQLVDALGEGVEGDLQEDIDEI